MYVIKKQLDTFSAAHRLTKGYQGKCKDLHGHDYQVEITLHCEQLDHYDFVIDFGEIKRICDAWLQQKWDHATIVGGEDPALLKFVKQEQQKYFLLPEGRNSTVEFLAEFLFEIFERELASFAPRVILHSVEIAESQTARALFVGKE